MNRKRAIVSVGLGGCLAALAGVAIWLFAYQPAFYQAALRDGLSPATRREHAKRFVQSTLQLVDDVRYEERWSQEFSDHEVNVWLADELPTRYAGWLPKGVAAPRVKFDRDGVWIAFQTRRGPWSGVISCRVKPWVAGPNELALEIRSLSAGLVPIPVDDVVGEIVDSMNENGCRLQWKQSESGDVLVISLDEATFAGSAEGPVLEAVETAPGRLRVSGCRRGAGATPRTAGRLSFESQDEGVGDEAVK